MMRKWLSYLYLLCLSGLLVWIVVNHPSTIFMLLAWIGPLAITFGIGCVIIYIQTVWRNFWCRRCLRRLLGGLPLEEVLARSPYQYGYVFQGDDGYRIWRKDNHTEFVQSGVSQKAAQMWIVEQYFKGEEGAN